MKITNDDTLGQAWCIGIDNDARRHSHAMAPAVGGRAALRADPRPAALHRLELSPNNVTKGGEYKTVHPTGRLMVRPHRCRCRTCESCGPIYGRKVRSRLLLRADEFRHPALFTLTVKPSHFDNDPRKAFEAITEGRYIARLMKKLGVRRWVWVLELQESGWPHWHLLIDKPGGFVDWKKAWAWWGWQKEHWKIGGVDESRKNTRDGRDAVLYISKYLVKYPEHGFPDWLLDIRRRIRWVQGSRSMGPLVSDREPSRADEAPDATTDEADEGSKVHTLRERQGECGGAVEFFREFVDSRTGEVRYRYVSRVAWESFEESRDRGEFVLMDEEPGRAFIADDLAYMAPGRRFESPKVLS